MTLRVLFIGYLLAVHVIAGGAVAYLLRSDRIHFFYIEAILLVSLGVGFVLLQRFFAPLKLLVSGAEFLRESDFSSRLQRTGQREMDTLIDVFNAMLAGLHDERLTAIEQRHLLSSIMKELPTGIIICDFAETISAANPSAEALLGRNLVGQTLQELPAPYSNIFTILYSEKHHHCSRVVSIGARRVRCTRVEFYDRGFVRSAFIVDELTEELRRSEKAAYEKLIRVFAHEINNSMGAVRSILQSLRTYTTQLYAEDRTDAETVIDIASERTNSLAAFVQSFAEIIRLPAPNLAPCDIALVVRNASILLQSFADEKQCQFTWNNFTEHSLESPPILILADKTQLEHVMLNVLKNALEASPDNAFLDITLEATPQEVRVALHNLGDAIPADIQAQLFTPFFTTKPYGQGIGLMLVREILTAHNARFSLENSSNGALFTMIFARKAA
ncbi:MAG: HAMP domain-containing protein [Candidatus Kapaibacterium sp.]|nr:MAG: HAMP domain-containing protein [Candidatus Kapabacteria bacterium]